MNTKNKQDQKNNRRPKAEQKKGPKKHGRNPNTLNEELKPHEQEHPETRLTR